MGLGTVITSNSDLRAFRHSALWSLQPSGGGLSDARGGITQAFWVFILGGSAFISDIPGIRGRMDHAYSLRLM